MNPEADREADTLLLLQSVLQWAQDLDDPQTSPDCPLGVIFMCLRITKVDQQAIPKQLGNVAVKALNDRGTGGLISADHVPQVFWIKLTGQRGRGHEITEEHRELAPFRVSDSGSRRALLRRRRTGEGGQGRSITAPDEAPPRIVVHLWMRV